MEKYINLIAELIFALGEKDILLLHKMQEKLVKESPKNNLKQIKLSCIFLKLHEEKWLHCVFDYFCNIQNLN